MAISDPNFVLCINSADMEDLEKGKVYQVLVDKAAELEGMRRVIDESGEDYLYPAYCFVEVDLPKKARQALVA